MEYIGFLKSGRGNKISKVGGFISSLHLIFDML